MSDVNQGVIMAGDTIHAGIDFDDVEEIENCVVLHFETRELMNEFLKTAKWYIKD